MGSSNLMFVGIILGVFASMTGTIGKQLLRYSELQNLEGHAYPAKVALVVGLVFNTALGPIVDIFSYMFAPQSLIAPLAGLDVVWNTLLAPFTLGEKLTHVTVLGVALIAVGATLTSVFGNHEDKDYTIDLLKDIFIRPAVAIYLGSLLVWVIFNVVALQSRGPLESGDLDPIRGLSLGLTAGSIAGNMFCAKGFIELVQASVRDSDGEIWKHWLPYCLLASAAFFAVSNLYFLTTAMREYEALFMGAVFEGSLIVCACVSGIVVFSDLEDLATYNVIVYFAALSGIVAGILLVSIGTEKKEDFVDDIAFSDGCRSCNDLKVESIASDVSFCSNPYSSTPMTTHSLHDDTSPHTAKLTLATNFNNTVSSWHHATEELSKHISKKENNDRCDASLSSPFAGQGQNKLAQMVSPLVSRSVKMMGIKIHAVESFANQRSPRDTEDNSSPPSSPPTHHRRKRNSLTTPSNRNSLTSPQARSPRAESPWNSHRPAHLDGEPVGKSGRIGISPQQPFTPTATHIQSDNSIEILAESGCDRSYQSHDSTSEIIAN